MFLHLPKSLSNGPESFARTHSSKAAPAPAVAHATKISSMVVGYGTGPLLQYGHGGEPTT